MKSLYKLKMFTSKAPSSEDSQATISTSYNQTSQGTSFSTYLNYTNIFTTTTETPLNEDEPGYDDGLWQLVNVIGLLVFVGVVLGPIVYVTFCCKRPPNRNGRCYECRRFCMQLCSCPRTCPCTEIRDVESTGEQSSVPIPRAERETDIEWRPPEYEEALTMERVEDTIQGTPPPIYKDLFKDKPPAVSFIKDSEGTDWYSCYYNRGFEDDDNLSVVFGGYSSFNSHASCGLSIRSSMEPRCSYITNNQESNEGAANTSDTRNRNNQQDNDSCTLASASESNNAVSDVEEVHQVLRTMSTRWRERERPFLRRAGLDPNSDVTRDFRRSINRRQSRRPRRTTDGTATEGPAEGETLPRRPSRTTDGTEGPAEGETLPRRPRRTTDGTEGETLPSYHDALVLLERNNEEANSKNTSVPEDAGSEGNNTNHADCRQQPEACSE